MSKESQPIYLAGQTGSGKTAISIEIAKRLGGVEIVNADAFQLYKGMPILSAAPSEEEKKNIPHHLYEFISPTEECDAARFALIARDKIQSIIQRGKTPLVTGGSGLYLKAITHGLAPTPKADPKVRNQLDSLSLDKLIEQYRELDPVGAEETNLKNRRYVTRNLEISLLSGKPASQIKREWANNAPDITAFYLHRERPEIYDRINRRTEQMFANGAVEEVARLRNLSCTTEKAIGIREIRSLLAGEIDEAACIEAIQQATRRYAKRQESWFKREADYIPVEVEPEEEAPSVAQRVIDQL